MGIFKVRSFFAPEYLGLGEKLLSQTAYPEYISMNKRSGRPPGLTHAMFVCHRVVKRQAKRNPIHMVSPNVLQLVFVVLLSVEKGDLGRGGGSYSAEDGVFV